MSLGLSNLRLGLAARRGGGAAFGVSLTGLTGGEARIGDHASISYTTDPVSATETVKWSNSSNPADAATYGTGASPTDYTAGDEGRLWLHVTDTIESESATVSRSAPIRYAPGAFAALTNQSFEEDGGNETYVFGAATGANLTWTYSLVSPPSGVTIVSATRTITFDTDTLALQSGTVIAVRALDQYGRNPGDRTFTLEITGTTADPVLTLDEDNLDQAPPEFALIFDPVGTYTVRWDFDASGTPPTAGNGDIGTGTVEVTSDESATIDLSAYPGDTGYLHFRVGGSNVVTSQEITVPSASGVTVAASAVSLVITPQAATVDTGSAFDPASLFGASEQGFFLDFASGNVFTDTARTTASGDTDSIRGVTDLSGNGHHFEDDGASGHPTWSSSVGGYMVCSGSQNALTGVNDIVMTATPMTLFAVVQKDSDASKAHIVTTNGAGFELLGPQVAGQDAYEIEWDKLGPSGANEALKENSYAAPHAATILTYTPGDGTTSPGIVLRINGTETTNADTVDRIGGDTEAVAVGGSIFNGNPFTGRIYAVLLIGRLLTAQEISDLEAWGDARRGA